MKKDQTTKKPNQATTPAASKSTEDAITNKSAKKAHATTPTAKSNSTIIGKIVKATFLVLWAFISIFFGQLLFALVFALIPGNLLEQSVWATVYSALSYAFSLFLILFIPHKFPKRWPLVALVLSSLILLYYLLLGYISIIFIITTFILAIICFKSINFSTFTSTSRANLGLSGLPTWTDIGLAPIGYIASLILSALIMAAFSIFAWFDLSEAQDVGFNSVYSGFDRLVTFIALVIIAPIAEEIIFRGWLYGKLRSFLNIPIAIFITSAFFGFMHGQWNVGLTVFGMSIILCLAREFTGTIYSGIIMHMLKNGVAFVLLYIVNIV